MDGYQAAVEIEKLRHDAFVHGFVAARDPKNPLVLEEAEAAWLTPTRLTEIRRRDRRAHRRALRTRGRRAVKDWIRQEYPWTCSMVAALNAARWWGLQRIPSQKSQAWKRWITRCGARYGAATQVELLHQHLGLAAIRIIPEAYAIEDVLAQNVPVEATIWVRSAGLHAVLLVPDHESCVLALGMIRKRTYVQERTSIERLLDRYCFPIGNPNRRFRALVPRKGT